MKNLSPTAFAFLAATLFSTLFAQKTIDLGKSDLEPDKRVFNISEIIDARRDKSSIGNCKVGMGNDREKILLNAPLDSALLAFFHQKMPDQPGLPLLTIRVQRFAVHETTSGASEVSVASIDLDVFLKKDGVCQKLQHIKARHNWDSGLDVTKWHDDNLRMALQIAVDKLRDSVDWKNLQDKGLSGLPVPEAEIRAAFIPKIMTDSIFKPGFYRNISEFRANQPSRNMKIEQENDKLLIFIEKENKPGKYRKLKPQDKAWGACDGTNFFYLKSGVFFQMFRQPDGNFRFEGYDIEKVKHNTAVAGAAFGVIGSIIANQTTKKNHSGLMELDLETGGFWPVK